MHHPKSSLFYLFLQLNQENPDQNQIKPNPSHTNQNPHHSTPFQGLSYIRANGKHPPPQKKQIEYNFIFIFIKSSIQIHYFKKIMYENFEVF